MVVEYKSTDYGSHRFPSGHGERMPNGERREDHRRARGRIRWRGYPQLFYTGFREQSISCEGHNGRQSTCSCRTSPSALRNTGRWSPTTTAWLGITRSRRRPTATMRRRAMASSCRCSTRTTVRWVRPSGRLPQSSTSVDWLIGSARTDIRP
jgi:hypothetical protein